MNRLYPRRPRRAIPCGLAVAAAALSISCDEAPLTTGGNQGGPRFGGGAGVHDRYYVSPSGADGDSGTITRPMSLKQALLGGNAIATIDAGDTVLVRGGTYILPQSGLTSTLSGSGSGGDVVVRAFSGEQPVIDGVNTQGNDNFVVTGDHSVYWGLEFTNTSPGRYNADPSNHHFRGNVVVNHGNHNKYINLIIHDGGQAFYNYAVNHDVEVNGCIIYNNGWDNSVTNDGHGLYLKSNTGNVRMLNNIIFNQYGHGIHAYSNAGGSDDGNINGLRLEGNVAFGSGAVSIRPRNPNILVGGVPTADDDTIVANYTFDALTTSGTNVRIGYGSTQNLDVRFENNYIVGRSTLLEFNYWSNAMVSGGTYVGNDVMVRLNDPNTDFDWGGNVHYRQSLSSGWRYNGAFHSFAEFQQAIAPTDQAVAGTPTTTVWFIRSSPYEPRVYVVFYRWGNEASKQVDLSAYLAPGGTYELRNVQKLGTLISSGAYTGTVTFPMEAVTPDAPIGGNPGPTTGPLFNVFVVTRAGTASLPTTMTVLGAVINGGYSSYAKPVNNLCAYRPQITGGQNFTAFLYHKYKFATDSAPVDYEVAMPTPTGTNKYWIRAWLPTGSSSLSDTLTITSSSTGDLCLL